MVLQDLPENKEPSVNLDPQVTMENLDPVVSKVWLVKRVTKDQEDSQDPQALVVYRVFLVNQDLKVTLVTVDLWDLLVKSDPVVLQDHKELTVQLDLLVELDNLVWLEARVNKDRSVLPDPLELLVFKDLKERMAKKENKVFKDHKVLLESEEPLVTMDPRDIPALSDSLVILVLLDLLANLVTMEMLVKMVILVTPAKLDHLDQWVNKDLLDLPEREAKLDLQALLDVKEKRVLKEKPALVVPLVALDLSDQSVKPESKALLDYKDCQDLLANPVFQEATVLMALLALRELKVRRVSRETLDQVVRRVILV